MKTKGILGNLLSLNDWLLRELPDILRSTAIYLWRCLWFGCELIESEPVSGSKWRCRCSRCGFTIYAARSPKVLTTIEDDPKYSGGDNEANNHKD